MKDNFDIICNRKGSGSVKWDSAGKIFGNENILPMWIADMDFKAPNPVIDILKQRVEHGFFGYIDKYHTTLYEAIASWMQKRHGWNIQTEWIQHTPCVVTALYIAVLAFTKPGDKVLLQSPVYHPFFSAIEKNKRQLVNSPLKIENNRYVMDFEDLEEKFRTGVKMIILCSPHNPVGRVWSIEELKRLSELCLKYNVLIVSDEIHSDIVYKGSKHTPIASISEEAANNIITCVAPSKTFNLAGLHSSSVIIENEKLRSSYIEALENLHIETGNLFGVTAAEAAYRNGEEWLEGLLSYLQSNLKFLIDYVNDIPGVSLIPPEGTYLAWLNMRNLGMNDVELKKFVTNKANLGLNEGIMFGQGGEGYQRLNFACPRATLEEGLYRLKEAVHKYIKLG